MSNNINKHIWLIGAGQMAVDYYQVIKDQKIKCAVIGRGELSARSFAKKTGFKPFVGGLNYFLKDKPNTCSHAIVAVGVEELLKTTKKLLKYGIKNILVEKPAGINKKEIEELSKITKKNNAKVFVAYNRRYFTSVIKAREIIEKDGKVISFEEKPQTSKGLINGGFMVFNKKMFDYLSTAKNCDLEFGPMEKLANEGQVMTYKHEGFWECADTIRDIENLNKLWTQNPPWKVW